MDDWVLVQVKTTASLVCTPLSTGCFRAGLQPLQLLLQYHAISLNSIFLSLEFSYFCFSLFLFDYLLLVTLYYRLTLLLPISRKTMDITCRDCSTSFHHGGSEQRFFEQKGFNPPIACKSCRAIRKGDPRQQALRKLRKDVDKAGGFIHDLNAHRNARNRIEDEFPDKRPKCLFCLNRGHNERACNIKQQATCNKCGKVGFADSEGFAQASGRNNVGKTSCGC